MLLIVLSGIAIGSYYLFNPLISKNIEMVNKEYQMKLEVEALEKENSRLRAEIQKIMDNPVFVEKVAREELGMGKPGEIVYRFRDE